MALVKNKTIQSKRLKNLDSVIECTFGDSTVEARRQGDYSKDGQAVAASASDDEFDDVKARQERFGLLY